MRLTVLHFNDLHGRLDQLPRLSSLIQRERNAALADGRAVLVLDGGDSSDRNCWESDITQGRANFALLEALGVQASVVGNGEALQWGRAALARLVSGTHFPLLAANLRDLADPAQPAVPDLAGSAMLEIDGWKIGLIGLTAIFRGGYDRFGYVSTDPRPALRREIDCLRAQGARTLILLSHLGCQLDPALKRADLLDDNDLPADFPELDLIIGGHTHTVVDPPQRVGPAVIAQAGDYGRWLGRVDLDLDPGAGRVIHFAGRLIPCDASTPIDPTLSATLELVREEAARLLERPVGRLSQAWPHAVDAVSPLAAHTADILRELCAADLAILFSGFVREGLSAGPVTRRDLYRAFPGATHVTAAQVSGAQLRRLVERMLASPYRTESLNPRRGEPPLGLPACSAGVRLEYDLSRAVDDRVTRFEIAGAPLDPAQLYRLASTYFTLSDILGDPEYDFIGLQPGQRVEMFQVENVLWQLVEEWFATRADQ